MSPPVVAFWLKKALEETAREGKSIVTSGYLRTIYEVEELIPVFKKLFSLKNIKVVVISLSEKETIFRNSHRKTCQLMRHPVVFTPETAKLTKCSLDNSNLIARSDDDPETIKTRLEEYRERTFPIIKLLEKEGLRIRKVNGSPPPAAVFKSILKVLK